MRIEENNPAWPQSTVVDPSEVRQQLERILRSDIFEKAQRSQRFLRHVVEAVLTNQGDAIKEYTIAIEVFDRSSGYDPAVDATVRVEAGRLRNRLRDYYSGEGRLDQISIEIPRGQYTPVFTSRGPIGSTDELGLPSQAPPNTLPHVAPPLETRRPGTRALLAAGAITMLIVAGILVVWNRQHRAYPHSIPALPVTLAILPIENQTGDPTLEYLSTGLTDSLIRQLSEVPALKLITHDAVFRFRDHKAGVLAIGRSLGATNVIAGTLHRSGGRLMVDAELSRVGDASVIFSREYLAEGNDLRLVQAGIERDTLTKLHVETSALDPSRPTLELTKSPAAYQEFLKGDFAVREPAAPQLHDGIAHFEKAVALDPAFDLAWASLAGAHVMLGIFFESPHQHMDLARQSAERAIQLNPTLGEAHGILGLIHLVYDWNIPAAETELASAGAERAAVNTLACTVHLLSITGRYEGAEEILRRVISFDPQSPALIGELGCINYYGGHLDAAIRDYREALRLGPQSPMLCWGLAKSLNEQKRYRESLEVSRHFKRDNGFEPPLITAEIGYSLGSLRDTAGAMAVVRDLQRAARSIYIDPYFVSVVYLSTGDRQSAFQWLDRALDERSGFMISILTEPKWKPLRSDPRFTKVVRKVLQMHSLGTGSAARGR